MERQIGEKKIENEGSGGTDRGEKDEGSGGTDREEKDREREEWRDR